MVRHVENMEQFRELLELSKTKLVVVDYTASWCGPCRMIGPKFEAMAAEYGDKVEFVKVDVDAADDVAAANGIRAMPTFHFFKGGEKVHEVMGANEAELRASVQKYC
ncbi:hypothetical protein ACA910_002147 [Epithemia clementina (nom. ined.)]